MRIVIELDTWFSATEASPAAAPTPPAPAPAPAPATDVGGPPAHLLARLGDPAEPADRSG